MILKGAISNAMAFRTMASGTDGIYFTISLCVVFILLLLIVFILTLYVQTRKSMRLRQREFDASVRYRNLIEEVPISFVKAKLILDGQGRIKDIRNVRANRQTRDWYEENGLVLGEKTLLETFPGSGIYFIEHLNEAMEAGEKSTRFALKNSELEMFSEVFAVFEGNQYVHIFMHDETEIIQARRSAEQNDRIKTQFVQNVSHEIRTPLNAIIGFSQLLSLPEGVNSEEEKLQYADYIQINSKMLMMLIDDILDLGDVEKGNYKVDICDTECNEILRQSIKSVEYRVPEGVKIYYTSEVDDSYLIHTDPRRVHQVLINYLTNSCKHTRQGEIHLHCSLSEIPGNVTFSVADTGTGVPPEMAENIFERFAKLNTFVQGAGLGLNICRTVASKLGGSVYLDTSYSPGARFVFTLPL